MNSTKGFSVVEILVVIAIIGILSGTVMTTISIAREKALKAKAELQISRIEHALKELALDTNKWPGNGPSHQEALCVYVGSGNNEVLDLNTTPGIVSDDTNPNKFRDWDGPYMDSIPADPWGHPYFLDTDYYVNDDDTPCNLDSTTNTGSCKVVAVIGSFGTNTEETDMDYDEEDVIKIIAREPCS